MTKINRFLARLLTTVLAVMLAFAFISCPTDADDPQPSKPLSAKAGLYAKAPPIYQEDVADYFISYDNVAKNDVIAAVAYAKAHPGPDIAYTLLIDSDADVTARQDIYADNFNLYIQGIGGMKTINAPSGGLMFRMSDGSNKRLTIGNNITLKGKTGGTTSYMILNYVGTLTLTGNAKITGHTTSSNMGTVYMSTATGGDPILIMEDNAEISGNSSTDTVVNATGGVVLSCP